MIRVQQDKHVDRKIPPTILRLKPLLLLWFLQFLISTCKGNLANSRRKVFTECGVWLTEPSGVISTPNFPKPYPVPIKCTWVIEAPKGKGIAVYFTQFYMREGVRISEYDFFDKSTTISKGVSSMVSSDAEPTRYIGLKSYLVLDFDVRESANVHMRVMDFFLDVYGFNVTYEVIDQQKDGRRDPCIENHCSFNGLCYASADFKTYACTCFEPYYGDECKYSPDCGPSSNDTMCLNGGSCRHYIGSRARKCECPSGYEGVFCERRELEVHSMDGSKDLGCEKTPNGTQVCACPSGKQLADGFRSCIVRETVRYVVSFKLQSLKVDNTHSTPDPHTLSPVKSMELKRHLQTALLSLLQHSLSRLESLLILDINHREVQFHFFGEKRETEKVKTLMEKAVRTGQISDYKVDPNFFHFEIKPSLNILNLKTSEKLPVTVGSQLTLECIISGSSKMEVTWYKDGFPINKSTSHQRMWTAVVPKNSQDQFTHLLGFDRTDVLDAGIFTCEVVEWGIIKKQNKQIYTRSPPQPKLIPLTATVLEGDNIELWCLLQEDASEKFGYTWLKNGEILNPSKEPEIVEDLFRTGSRLVIKSINSSATYTCIVTSSAGRTSRKSNITVLKPNDFPVCPAQRFKGLMWKLTAANSEYKHHCPKGFRGIVSRFCSLKQTVAEWEEPDFSSCLDKHFLIIKNKLRTLEIGYVQNNLSSVLTELKQYLQRRAKIMYPGEGEPIVNLLSNAYTFVYQQYLNNVLTDNNIEVTLDIVSLLLDHPHLIQKQFHFVKIHQLLLNHGLMKGSFTTIGETQVFARDALVLEIKRVVGGSKHVLSFSSLEVNQQNNRRSEWLKDKLNLTFNTHDLRPFQNMKDSVTVAAVFYRNLTYFLPARIQAIKKIEDRATHERFSQVVGVAMMTGRNMKRPEAGTVKLQLSLQPKKEVLGSAHNLTCGRIDYSNQKFQYYLDECNRVMSRRQVVCVCDRVGTFVLVLSSFLETTNGDTFGGFEKVTGTGCIVCICFLSLTLSELVICWRHVSGAITALKIQFTSTVIGFYSIFLRASYGSLSQNYYLPVLSVLTFFLLSAFCMLLCVVLTVYVECVNMQCVNHLKLKIVLMGWVVPASIVGATLVAQALEGLHIQRWWLTIGTNFFYSFTSSATIILTLHILLYMILKAKLKEQEKLGLLMLKKNHIRIGLVHRSSFVFLSLILASSSSIFYINDDHVTSRYFFALSSTFLGVLSLLLFVACDENYRHSRFCLRSDRETQQNHPTSNSFKMYVRPEVNCNRNHNLDMNDCPQKRAERISRMRSEIEKQEKPYKHTKNIVLPNLYVSTENKEMRRFHHPVKSYQGCDDILCFELQELEVNPLNSHSHGNNTVDLRVENNHKQITLSISTGKSVSSSSGILGGVNSLFEYDRFACFDSTNPEHEVNGVHLDQVISSHDDVFISCGSVSTTEEEDDNKKYENRNSSSLENDPHPSCDSRSNYEH